MSDLLFFGNKYLKYFKYFVLPEADFLMKWKKVGKTIFLVLLDAISLISFSGLTPIKSKHSFKVDSLFFNNSSKDIILILFFD